MYDWYAGAIQCVAYLADVELEIPQTFEQSDWFTRGWTLQELLAPNNVVFCDSQWRVIGHKVSTLDGLETDLGYRISKITGIPEDVLCVGAHGASVAQKLSWASRRVTTRLEDEAYCLLGLLGVNMSLIYGEGSKAFQRLQREIIYTNTDQSIFAWQWHEHNELTTLSRPMLSPSITHFRPAAHVVAARFPDMPRRLRVTNEGVEMEANLAAMNVDVDKLETILGRPMVPRDYVKKGLLEMYILRLGCEIRTDLEEQGQMGDRVMELILVKSQGMFYRLIDNSWGLASQNVPGIQMERQRITISNKMIRSNWATILKL